MAHAHHNPLFATLPPPTKYWTSVNLMAMYNSANASPCPCAELASTQQNDRTTKNRTILQTFHASAYASPTTPMHTDGAIPPFRSPTTSVLDLSSSLRWAMIRRRCTWWGLTSYQREGKGTRNHQSGVEEFEMGTVRTKARDAILVAVVVVSCKATRSYKAEGGTLQMIMKL